MQSNSLLLQKPWTATFGWYCSGESVPNWVFVQSYMYSIYECNSKFSINSLDENSARYMGKVGDDRGGRGRGVGAGQMRKYFIQTMMKFLSQKIDEDLIAQTNLNWWYTEEDSLFFTIIFFWEFSWLLGDLKYSFSIHFYALYYVHHFSIGGEIKRGENRKGKEKFRRVKFLNITILESLIPWSRCGLELSHWRMPLKILSSVFRCKNQALTQNFKSTHLVYFLRKFLREEVPRNIIAQQYDRQKTVRHRSKLI